MKKYSTLLLFAILLCLGIQACDDGNSSEPKPEPVLGTFTATVNNSPFKAMLATAVKEDGAIVVTGIVLNGTQIEGIAIALSNYRMGENTAPCIYTVLEGQNPKEAWGELSAKVNITKLTDTEISGTFSFAGVDYLGGMTKKEAKDGVFRVNFSKAEDLPI